MKSNDSIIILGGSHKQLPLIQKANTLGFKVITVDKNPYSKGFSHSYVSINESIHDTDSIVKHLNGLQDLNIQGVCTIAAEAAISVAKLSERLGSVSCSVDAARNATDKILRHECFKRGEVSTPKNITLDKIISINEIVKYCGFPFVLKPRDGAGSRGVQLIQSESDFVENFKYAQSVSKYQEVIVEEFLKGSEHSIEGIVLNGQIHWTAISDRNYDRKFEFLPFFLEDGDTMPTELNRKLISDVKEEASKAVKSLNILNGPVKGDILISNGKVYILEIAARLSGDYFCSHTAPLCNGIDIMKAVIVNATNGQVSTDELQQKYEKGVALRYYWPKPGIVKSINGLEAARNVLGNVFINKEPKYEDLGIGGEISEMKAMGDRVLAVLATGKTRFDAIESCKSSIDKISIVTTAER